MIILSSQLVVLQSFEVGSDPVRALEWHSKTGQVRHIDFACLRQSVLTTFLQLAVACGSEILIYRLTPSELDSASLVNLRMERLYVLESNFTVDALAWEPVTGRYLLAGGSSLVLWEFRQGFLTQVSQSAASGQDRAFVLDQLEKLFNGAEFRIASTLQCESPDSRRAITMLAFSPDGTMFASCGQTDRCVKVWFHSSVSNFNFVYLPHPRAVSGFEWRLPYTTRSVPWSISLLSASSPFDFF